MAPEFIGHYPDVVAGFSGTSQGPESLMRDLDFIAAMVPDFRTTLEDLVGAGDRVAIRGTTQGTHTGEVPGVPPTGNAVHFTWCAIYRFDNGRIVERWLNDDALSTFQQLGMIRRYHSRPIKLADQLSVIIDQQDSQIWRANVKIYPISGLLYIAIHDSAHACSLC